LKAERGDGAALERSEASRGGSVRLKESRVHNVRAQGEAARADTGAASSSPEDQAQRIHEGSNTRQQVFNGNKTPSAGRRI